MKTDLVLHDGEDIPAILTLPKASEPVSGAVLLHGFSSRKEQMANSVGRALERRGVASIAIDLPLHGAREQGVDGLSIRSPLALVQKWRLTVREGHQALEFLAGHPAIDPRRIGIVGYSLGAYLAVMIASSSPLVRAVVLAAGGDLPERTPFASLVRTIADPIRAVRGLAGRPLLMVNGRFDRTILPSQAQALFAAAGDPKELRWYEGGHWPPDGAIRDAADWLATHLGETNAHARRA
jgi:dienelactone hydrolase